MPDRLILPPLRRTARDAEAVARIEALLIYDASPSPWTWTQTLAAQYTVNLPILRAAVEARGESR